jgi:hypothetical protein
LFVGTGDDLDDQAFPVGMKAGKIFDPPDEFQEIRTRLGIDVRIAGIGREFEVGSMVLQTEVGDPGREQAENHGLQGEGPDHP